MCWTYWTRLFSKNWGYTFWNLFQKLQQMCMPNLWCPKRKRKTLMISRTNIFHSMWRNSFSNFQAKTERLPDKLLFVSLKLRTQFTLEEPQSLKISTRPNSSKNKEGEPMSSLIEEDRKETKSLRGHWRSKRGKNSNYNKSLLSKKLRRRRRQKRRERRERNMSRTWRKKCRNFNRRRKNNSKKKSKKDWHKRRNSNKHFKRKE